jgi:hypothetical protein
MSTRLLATTVMLWSLGISTGYAQQCLHGESETSDQAARRREALTATRNINNIQANQPGAATGTYFQHAELANAPYAATIQRSTNDVVRRISLNPYTDILPGWKLTLNAFEGGYWFMIKDTTDPCGFAYISNRNGVIFTAEPIR